MLNTLTKTILELSDVQWLKPNFELIGILPKPIATAVQAVIFDGEKNRLSILTTNNFPTQLQQIIQRLESQGYICTLYYTDPAALEQALTWYDAKQQAEATAAAETLAQKEAAWANALSLITKTYDERSTRDEGDFIVDMVRYSFQSGASDLHLQPEEDGVHMRVRIDGVLKDLVMFDHEEFARYLQKIKFMSGMKMNIDYVPQDGRFSFTVEKGGQIKTIDVRVNCMPGTHNESTVMRYLDGTKGIQSFEHIGFWGPNYELLKTGLQANFGLILVTGPTGSGKTTTLYSMLNTLNDGSRKIITLEDPIEYMVKGLQQSQINYNKGYDYATGLKAILRHDPEVILIGETRDAETAQIALNAALTGHLVFTTLHTNGALEAISRITNMWVQGYMLAPALSMVMGQRLVRKLCSCATRKPADYAEAEQIKETIKKITEIRPGCRTPSDNVLAFDGQIMQAVGCSQCNGTGYKGRVAVVEILHITDEIKQMIISGKSTLDIYAKAREWGFLTLQEDAIIKLVDGQTTMEEVRRVV